MILAAGRGKRMMPLTASKPKPMLELNNKPLIQHQIEKLRNAGFNDFIINHCYLGEQLVEYFDNGSQLNINIQWSKEIEALETAGGIKQAIPLLGNEPFLLVNGDTWTDYPFEQLKNSKFLPSIYKKKYLAHLILVKNPQQNPKGDFGLKDNILKNTGQPMWTYSGIGIYHPDIVKTCSLGKPMSLTPILRNLANDLKISGEIFQGKWHDIGTPKRLKTLEEELQMENL